MNKVILFLIILCSFRISAQQTLPITKINNFQFKFVNRVDKLHNLVDLFQDDESSKFLFSNFNKARKKQRTANITAASILGISTLGGIISASNCKSSEWCGFGEALIWVGANSIGFTYALLTNLMSGQTKGRYKKELIDYLNIYQNNFLEEGNRETISFSNKSKRWTIGNASGKFHQLGPSLIHDHNSLERFHSYNNYRISENRRFVTSGILGTYSLLYFLRGETCYSNGASGQNCYKHTGDRGVRIFSGIASIGFGSLALLARKQKLKAQQALVNYNNGISTHPDLGMETAPSLDLIMGSNGIGLAYTF